MPTSTRKHLRSLSWGYDSIWRARRPEGQGRTQVLVRLTDPEEPDRRYELALTAQEAQYLGNRLLIHAEQAEHEDAERSRA